MHADSGLCASSSAIHAPGVAGVGRVRGMGVRAALAVPAFCAGLLVAGLLGLAPAAAQSGIYGHQSSYDLYSRSAASGGYGWRPGTAPVYPSGNVYQSAPAEAGGGRGAYGYAQPAPLQRAARPAARGQGQAVHAAAGAGASRVVGGAARGASAATPVSAYVEEDADYYDEDAAPMPLYRPSTGARGVDRKFDRRVVRYTSSDPAGTVIIDTGARFLYLIQGNGTALRYGIGVGKEGFQWSGSEKVSRKAEWPSWRPPEEMLARRPDLPRIMDGGGENPMGARAIYLGNTLYRVHGTNEPDTIGQAVSSGCIRMRNEDVIDLYDRVRIGSTVRVI